MIDYEKYLNPEQLEVVMAGDGPLLVIAGAGSGKTRALTYRVTRLIESGVSPERILLATFTNKAARAMLSRVEALTDVDIKRLWGGTFHHTSNRILRKYSYLLGYENNYSIMDQEDSRQLINTCMSELELNTKLDGFPGGNVVGDIISFAINTNGSITSVIKRRFPYLYVYAEQIQKIAGRYEVRKKELNMMDFDDLLCNLRKLLVNFPEVKKEYSQRFVQILVDEYQDTNIVQAEILDLLASCHRNIMVVGDDSQSIYSFRGANFSNIIHFPERYPDVNIFKLETNYRSTPEILHVANMSITNNENQFQKELRPVRGTGIRPVYVPLRNVLQQADFVSQRIIELLDEGTPPGEIAVLYRAHYHSMELQMELTKRGIPFEIRSGIRFFEQAHIKDVTAFMRLFINPFDELAWKRVLKLYKKIGKVAVGKIWTFIMNQKDPVSSVFSDDFLQCVSKGATPSLLEFRSTVESMLELYQSNTISKVINAIMDTGYRQYLRGKYPDINSREEDLNQLANFSTKFGSMEDFLNELALLTNIAEENETYLSSGDDGRILLGSIHQAKGLEWSTVFIIWCSEGMMPLARSLREPGGEDEERRLFYVAITRAKDQLYFCHPVMNYTRGMDKTVLPPSRFLKELAPSHLEPAEIPFDQWMVEG
jgi:DNA helicase-2/ATP-dependent DNA helicase PcrA